jgi:hypothetical protein
MVASMAASAAVTKQSRVPVTSADMSSSSINEVCVCGFFHLKSTAHEITALFILGFFQKKPLGVRFSLCAIFFRVFWRVLCFFWVAMSLSSGQHSPLAVREGLLVILLHNTSF